MNFPDIDTCRAIADEFPDAEYAWLEIRGKINPIPLNVKQAFETGTAVKYVAPAPICEELGEYLHGKGFALAREWCGIGKWILYKNNFPFDFIDGELNETQARAEAVKLIKGQQK